MILITALVLITGCSNLLPGRSELKRLCKQEAGSDIFKKVNTAGYLRKGEFYFGEPYPLNLRIAPGRSFLGSLTCPINRFIV